MSVGFCFHYLCHTNYIFCCSSSHVDNIFSAHSWAFSAELCLCVWRHVFVLTRFVFACAHTGWTWAVLLPDFRGLLHFQRSIHAILCPRDQRKDNDRDHDGLQQTELQEQEHRHWQDRLHRNSILKHFVLCVFTLQLYNFLSTLSWITSSEQWTIMMHFIYGNYCVILCNLNLCEHNTRYLPWNSNLFTVLTIHHRIKSLLSITSEYFFGFHSSIKIKRPNISEMYYSFIKIIFSSLCSFCTLSPGLQ